MCCAHESITPQIWSQGENNHETLAINAWSSRAFDEYIGGTDRGARGWRGRHELPNWAVQAMTLG